MEPAAVESAQADQLHAQSPVPSLNEVILKFLNSAKVSLSVKAEPTTIPATSDCNPCPLHID